MTPLKASALLRPLSTTKIKPRSHKRKEEEVSQTTRPFVPIGSYATNALATEAAKRMNSDFPDQEWQVVPKTLDGRFALQRVK